MLFENVLFYLSIFNSWLQYLSFYCLCSFSGCCHGNLTWPLIASWVLTSACTPLLKPQKNKWQMALLQSPSHTFLHKETTLGVQMLTIPSKVFQRVHNTSDRTKKKRKKKMWVLWTTGQIVHLQPWVSQMEIIKQTLHFQADHLEVCTGWQLSQVVISLQEDFNNAYMKCKVPLKCFHHKSVKCPNSD